MHRVRRHLDAVPPTTNDDELVRARELLPVEQATLQNLGRVGRVHAVGREGGHQPVQGVPAQVLVFRGGLVVVRVLEEELLGAQLDQYAGLVHVAAVVVVRHGTTTDPVDDSSQALRDVAVVRGQGDVAPGVRRELRQDLGQTEAVQVRERGVREDQEDPALVDGAQLAGARVTDQGREGVLVPLGGVQLVREEHLQVVDVEGRPVVVAAGQQVPAGRGRDGRGGGCVGHGALLVCIHYGCG